MKGSDIHRRVCDFFHEHATRRSCTRRRASRSSTATSMRPGTASASRCTRAGRGEVESEPLVEGDVIALEPGLYRHGYGGVRLEDLILVTADGAELLTCFPYDFELLSDHDQHDPDGGPALPAAAVVRPRSRSPGPTSTSASSRSSGTARVASASAGSGRSRSSTNGSCRTRSGTSAARSTSPTTASTAMSTRGSATGSPTTGRASRRPTDARSPTPS